MTKEEMQAELIERYAAYQRIKKANKEENEVLDYEIKVTSARLSTLGVNVEDLTL